MDVDEYAAFVGATFERIRRIFLALCRRRAQFFLGGVVLPAVTNTTPPNGIGTGTAAGGNVGDWRNEWNGNAGVW